LRWIEMDCDNLRWIGSQNTIQTPHHNHAPHPNSMRSRQPHRCAHTDALRARARSKRRYTLKTALRVQTVLRVQTRFGRGFGRLVGRVRQGFGRGSAD
jgi:hypothetical protein